MQAFYGKSIENPEGRMDCRFVMSETQADRRLRDPSMKSMVICSEDLVMTMHSKKEVHLDQSWAVGFSILELSKLWMQQLFYNHIKPKYGSGVSVMLSDTDSLTLLVDRDNVSEVMMDLHEIVDTSNYPEDHHLYDPSRKNALG